MVILNLIRIKRYVYMYSYYFKFSINLMFISKTYKQHL